MTLPQSWVGDAVAGGLLEAAVDPVLVPLQLPDGGLLSLAVVFFVLALGAALVGARGIAGISMEIAWVLVLVFLVLAVVTLVL